jgi:hypothetical protein
MDNATTLPKGKQNFLMWVKLLERFGRLFKVKAGVASWQKVAGRKERSFQTLTKMVKSFPGL